MRPDALRAALAAGEGPTIVCAQAGEVNSGAFDPFDADRATSPTSTGPGSTSTAPSACGPAPRPRTATWWPASGAPTRGPPTRTSGSTSLTTAGLAFVAHPAAHRAAFSASAAYLPAPRAARRDRTGRPTPRAARAAFAIWAALRSLGRDGVAELVERCCALRAPLRGGARRGARASRSSTTWCSIRSSCASATTTRPPMPWSPRCRPRARAGWAPTTWRGRRAMRISVSHWATTISDVDRSCAAILAVARAPLAPLRSR